MPGHNKKRFVELTPAMEDQFTCGICKEVLSGPVATPCCGHTFCTDCITKWSDTYKNCHNCSRPLSAGQLVPQPRTADYVATFPVTCRHAKEGCGHVCPLDVEPFHVRNDCRYNPERYCAECGAMKKLDAEHSCVQHLATVAKNAEESTRDLLNGLTEMREQLDTNIECGLNEITGLKNALDEMRSEMRKEIDEKVASLKVDLSAKLDKTDLVPIGFIFVQLPGQESPEELWPDFEWQDVSSEYANLFFRVEGNKSEPFGTVQEQQGRALRIRSFNTGQINAKHIDTSISDSSQMASLTTGPEMNGSYYMIGVNLNYGEDEIRPRNKAVRVWKRVN